MLAITAASGTGFTVSATAQGAQAKDTACNKIELEVTGGEAKRSQPDCWKK
jgi:Tfp pilus assembly protein PilE